MTCFLVCFVGVSFFHLNLRFINRQAISLAAIAAGGDNLQLLGELGTVDSFVDMTDVADEIPVVKFAEPAVEECFPRLSFPMLELACRVGVDVAIYVDEPIVISFMKSLITVGAAGAGGQFRANTAIGFEVGKVNIPGQSNAAQRQRNHAPSSLAFFQIDMEVVGGGWSQVDLALGELDDLLDRLIKLHKSRAEPLAQPDERDFRQFNARVFGVDDIERAAALYRNLLITSRREEKLGIALEFFRDEHVRERVLLAPVECQRQRHIGRHSFASTGQRAMKRSVWLIGQLLNEAYQLLGQRGVLLDRANIV